MSACLSMVCSNAAHSVLSICCQACAHAVQSPRTAASRRVLGTVIAGDVDAVADVVVVAAVDATFDATFDVEPSAIRQNSGGSTPVPLTQNEFTAGKPRAARASVRGWV